MDMWVPETVRATAAIAEAARQRTKVAFAS